MTGDMPKKMLFPCVTKLLSENTDCEEDAEGKKIHSMTQADIIKRLAKDYGLKVDRKSFGRNIKELMAFDDRIQCTVKSRRGEELSPFDDDEGAVYTDFCFEHLFDKSQLQAIIYNIAFARHLPASYKKDLIEKLEELNPFASKHNIRNLITEDSSYKGEFSGVFMNMEDIESAINSRSPISIRTTHYRADKTRAVSALEYIVMPLGIAAGRGDFYLLCCFYGVKGVENPEGNKFAIYTGPEKGRNKETWYFVQNLGVPPEKVSEYIYSVRIDRIRDIKILDRTEVEGYKDMLAAFEKRGGKEKSLEFTAVNPSLSSGRTINASFRLTTAHTGVFAHNKTKDCTISDVIDYFGKPNVMIKDEGWTETENVRQQSFLVHVKTGEGALKEFAKANIESVQVLSPDYIRDAILDALKKACERMQAADGKK